MSLASWWVVFVGTFFLGESVILAASALAAHPVGFFGGRGLARAGVDLTRFEVGFAAVVVVAVLMRGGLLWRRRR